jgi:phosphoribosyl-AMP cyclohydrolase
MQVEQIGGMACHTGRHNCFYLKLEQNRWVEMEPVIKDSEEIYGGAPK